MRTPVDFERALVEPVPPLAQRVLRRPQRRSIFAHTHSAPVYRLDVHRPERLQGVIACVRTDPKALPRCLSQALLPLFTALFPAQFRLVFRELARKIHRQRANVL